MIRPVQSELFAVIGHPAAHSLSPRMMNAAFKNFQIAAVYVALDVDDLETDLETLAAAGFRGLSVTSPHKETALRIAVETDETARIIGAVNTLRFRGDGWEGRNTDWIGAVEALKRETDLAYRNALVLGAGGAARAVAYGLKREGATVTVTNRSRERGENLAGALGCGFVPLETLREPSPRSGYEIIVQCTSAGLTGQETILPVSDALLEPGVVVMDIVYRPLWTPLLQAAARKGCRVVNGLEMLVHQGIAQLEWWIDGRIPRLEGERVMRKALEEALAGDTHA